MKTSAILKKYYIIITFFIIVQIVDIFNFLKIELELNEILKNNQELLTIIPNIKSEIILSLSINLFIFIFALRIIYVLNTQFIKPINKLVNINAKNTQELSLELQEIITGNGEISKSLEQIKERYYLILEGSSSGVWDYNITDNQFFVSERFKEILGYKNEDNFNLSYSVFQNLIHPEDYENNVSSLRQHLNQKERYEVECRVKQKNNEYVYVKLKGQAIWNNDNKNPTATRIAGSITLIQKRKMAETKLRNEQEFLSLAFSATEDGIWYWDLRNNAVWLSKRWKEMLGYDYNEIDNSLEAWKSLVLEEDMNKMLEMLKLFQEGKIKEFSSMNRYKHKKGHIVYILSKAVHQKDENGTPIRLVGSNIDMSKMQKIIDDAEAASQAKSEFLANMSHEIRTPMNGIIGMCSLILKSKLKPKQTYYAELIKKSADNLMEIINEVLDFSKIEAGKLELEEAQFDMRESIEEVIDLLSIKAIEKNIEIFLQYDVETPNIVHADLVRIKQIINNLIGNAIKFTTKGYILVSVKSGRIENGKHIFHFGVEDTGVGIPERKRKTIFQKFTQEDSSTTRKYGGTGLGLTISKQLIQEMGGDIGVVSEVGFGSKFWFHIKLKADPVELSSEFNSLEGMKLLMLDLPTPYSVLITDILKQYGVKTQAVVESNFLPLLNRHADEQKPFDVVILDHYSLGKKTEELINNIKSNDHTKDVKIIITTAVNQKGNVGKYSELGCHAYLIKPLKHNHIIKCFSKLSKVNSEIQDNQILTKYLLEDNKNLDENHQEFYHAKILVAEDNYVNQEVISATFKNLGCNLTIAENGKEAVEMVQKEKFDIIFMDCQMPVMDGFEASNQICKLQEDGVVEKDLAIIALTANALQEDKDRCLRAGMKDFATKPIDDNKINSLITKWIIKRDHSDIIEDSKNDESETTHAPESNNITEDNNLNGLKSIDQKTIEHLKSIVKNKFNFLLSQYIKDTEKSIATISQISQNQAQWSDQEHTDFKRSAHSSKSSTGQIGALKLATIFTTIETKATTKNMEGINEIIESLKEEFENVKQEIESIKSSES